MPSNPSRTSDQTAHASPPRRPSRPHVPVAHADTGIGGKTPSDPFSDGIAANSALKPENEATGKTCPGCGTEIPRREMVCAICERAGKVDPSRTRTTILHWLIFTILMSLIFGLGYLLAP